MKPLVGKDIWSKKEEEVLVSLDSSLNGLSEGEANTRLRRFGHNILKKKKFKGFKIFFRQFKSPLLWLLFGAVIIAAIWGEKTDSIIIFSIILLSSLLSFYNEYRSEKIVEDLTRKIASKAIVMRGGEKKEINVQDIVQGDIVYLSIGSIVPADLRLLQTKDLEVNEAILTGESLPTHKIANPLKSEHLEIRDQKNCAFQGTIVSAGEGIGIVTATALRTEFGRISGESVKEHPQTEFQKSLTSFGILLLKITLILTLSIFFVNALLKHDILGSFLFALTIAIGLTPELLPAIISVSLARGAHKMAKKEVVVKRLISIEDFGNMDILCTDKTGTLTEGTLSVFNNVDINQMTDEKILLYGALCNSTIVHGKKLIGDPIDVAIWRDSSKILRSNLMNYTRIDDIPFDYTRKRMSVIVHREGDGTQMIAKGSPISILKVCNRVSVKGNVKPITRYRKKIESTFIEMSKKGLRVVAVAYASIPDKKSYEPADEKNLTFLGFITFVDPPKKTTAFALERLKRLGVDFKILTGDNEIITEVIAKEAGLPIKRIVIASEIDNAKEDELKELVEEANIFCRLSPEHKAKVIKVLRGNGHDVGYLGDGVNDILALHEADVGISVNDAVDVTKDASDVILLRKSLETLAEGVVEGRKIFNNTMKYIFMGTSSNFGNMVSAAGSSVFLPFIPMLPTQILLVNLLYDSSQLAVPIDNVDEENLRKPKRMQISLIKSYMILFGLISSIYDFLTFFVMLYIFNASQTLFRTGWFVESMMTELLVVFIIRTNRVPFLKSKPGKWLVLSSCIIGLVVLLLPFTPLSALFGFTALPWRYFIILGVMVLTYLLIVEAAKVYFFKRHQM